MVEHDVISFRLNGNNVGGILQPPYFDANGDSASN